MDRDLRSQIITNSTWILFVGMILIASIKVFTIHKEFTFRIQVLNQISGGNEDRIVGQVKTTTKLLTSSR